MPKAPAQIKSLARAHTETALNVLSGIMSNEDAPPRARVTAAQALLDRGWGKPTQKIGGDSDEDPIQIARIECVIIDPQSPGSESIPSAT